MAYYIVIRGPPAVGKSTISIRLASRISAQYICLDNVRREFRHTFSEEDKIKTLEKALPRVLDKLESGRSVILEEVFYYPSQFRYLENNLPFDRYIFSLQASLEECVRRDAGRSSAMGEARVERVYGFVSRYDCGIKIETKGRHSEDVVDEITSHLPA